MGGLDFTRPPADFARDLIGARLLIEGVGGLIVETEAYDAGDPASHSFKGAGLRNAAMFGPVGRAYVYRSHGLHWCLNVVCGPQAGGAVLIRALAPQAGVEVMRQRRGREPLEALCSGPGKLCQALAVTRHLDGAPLDAPPFSLTAPATAPPIVAGPRIGISRGVETPWRFGLTGSPFLSRRFTVA